MTLRLPAVLAATSRDVFRYFSAAMLVLVALSVAGTPAYLSARIAWFGIAWVLLGAFVFFFAPPIPQPSLAQPSRRSQFVILGGLVAGTWILRLLPQQHTDVAVGYDYGFYKATMDAYAAALPNVPETTLAPWIRAQFEPGLFLLQDTLFQVGGLSSFDHLRTLFPILSSLLVVPIFAVTRSYLDARAGLFAAAFYAASFSQYTTYEYLYEKNVLAMGLFFTLLLVVRRRAWIPVGLLLGAIGLYHRPTFLLAALSLAVVGTIDVARTRQWKGWGLCAAVSLPVFVPLWLLRGYFEFGFLVIQRAGDNVGAAVPEGGGTFLSFLEYQNAAVTYLPLALLGAILLLRRRDAILPAVAFLVAFVDVAFHIVFFNRFIIMLDLVAFPLVGAAFLSTVPAARRWVRPAVLSILLALTAYPTLAEAQKEPGPPFLWINDAQYRGIEWAREHLPGNATLLASNLDSPYLKADSGRTTYGPGLFDDPHNAGEWRRFFTTTDPDAIRAFLSVYGAPLYVFHADGHGPGLGTAKFTPPLFTKVYDASGARIWRYDG